MHRLKVIFKCLLLEIVFLDLSYAGEIGERPVLNNTLINKTVSSWDIIDPDAIHGHGKYKQPDKALPLPHSGPEKNNPCDRELPKKPNFFTPGRRISEAKCDEFIWDFKHKDDESNKQFDCDTYIRYRHLGHIPVVLGGITALPGQFPHMGALGWKDITGGWRFLCGCSVISPKFVLTAAHCSRVSSLDTSLADVNPKIVRLGDVSLFNRTYDVNIARIIVHPEYAPPGKYHDIALVELDRLLGKRILPACLWNNFDTSLLGNRAIVTGWGYTDLQNRQTSSDLQAAEVDIIDSSQCDALLRPTWNRHFSGLQPHQLCAGVLAGGVDTCQGDSGGPLQVRIPISALGGVSMHYYIIGVTSFGKGCGRANIPAVYTRVSSFLDWIEDIVWREQT